MPSRAAGRMDEAITAYRQALLYASESAELLNKLGNALRIHGQLEEAEAALRQCVRTRS